MANKKGLGRGLDAIFMQNNIEESEVSSKEFQTISISEIEPNRNQPRKNFDIESISDLAQSIQMHGILQPLIVRKCDDYYQIIAGERRWRACRMAGITEVPVIIKDLSESETMQLALVENLQREDLSPVEEARGFETLIKTFELSQEQVSKTVGKSRSTITNSLRLLKLPEIVLEMLESSKISSGHAKVLLSLKKQDEMIEMAQLVWKQNLSVRQLEKICELSNNKNKSDENKKEKENQNSFYREVELSLMEFLNRKIKVSGNKHGKGTISIEFHDEADLSDLSRLFGG